MTLTTATPSTRFRPSAVRISIVMIALTLLNSSAWLAGAQVVTHEFGGLKGIVELPSGELISARWQRTSSGSSIIEVRSIDHGRTWADAATVLTAPPGTDVGDGNLWVVGPNQLLLCYRYNRQPVGKTASFSIRVQQSDDGGRSWRMHSIVAQSASAEPRGLWAPFLFKTKIGRLLCFYDDEQTPQQQGCDRQQYVSVKSWDDATRQWIDRRTVCRSHDSSGLSRDGMATVVQLPDGRLLATCESVRRTTPYTNVIRSVTSSDDGKTWSWQDREPSVVYATKDAAHLAVSPWLIALRTGRLACYFATDEDQPRTVRPGSLPSTFQADIKVVYSNDGRTWSAPSLVYAGAHRDYMPAAFEMTRDEDRAVVLVQAIDFAGVPPRVQVILQGGSPR